MAPTPPAEKYTLGRPTDVAWDPQGNIFVSDGYTNHRVVKYDKNGRFLKQVGSEKPGSEPSQFNTPHGIAVDLKGNVYVADRANHRIQVFDNNLERKAIYDNIGDSWTVCVSPGPHQYLFTSNSNPNGNAPGSWDITGEIYKMELDGTILGRFGHAGKELGGFQVVHMMDCRNPNQIFVAEIESWRVQKLLLKPQAPKIERIIHMRRFLKSSLAAIAIVPGFRRRPSPCRRSASILPIRSSSRTTSIWVKWPASRPTRKGDIFVYTRTGHPTISLGTSRPFAHGGSRLFEFDKTGKFVREIGQESYAMLVAQQVRVDPQDNVWIVDQMSSMVIKFDPNGQIHLLLGRKSESERVPAAPLNRRPAAGRRRPGPWRTSRRRPAEDVFQRPTDVAWDAAGNIYVADGFGNARIAKFDKHGKFIKSWGSKGTDPGQFNTPHGLAIDAQGNVYVADTGNKRIQVFDGEGTLKTPDRERWRSGRDLHHARSASIPVYLKFQSAERYRRGRRDL